MGPLKQDFLEIYLITFSGVRNFGKEISYEGHLFFEKFLNLMEISKIPKKT